MSKERLKYIDVLRVMAMILVLVCHYTRSLEYKGVGYCNKILPDYICGIYIGGFGVSIFFILSGASLMYNYSGDGKFNLKQYVTKRFLGIYPMFYLAWMMANLYFFWQERGFHIDAPKWKIIWTVLGVDGYFGWYGANFYRVGEWFLGCLILLYVLFPILKWGIEKHPVITAAAVLLVYFVGQNLYTHLLYERYGGIPTANFVLFRVPEFAFGMYLVHFKLDKKKMGALISALILIVPYIVDLSGVDDLYKIPVVGICTVWLISCLCQYLKTEWLFDLCRKIGRYSYAVFLTHHIIAMDLVFHFSGIVLSRLENLLLFILYILIVALASRILYDADKKLRGLIIGTD